MTSLPDSARAARAEREATEEKHTRARRKVASAVQLEQEREAMVARVNQARLLAECRARQAERGTT